MRTRIAASASTAGHGRSPSALGRGGRQQQQRGNNAKSTCSPVFLLFTIIGVMQVAVLLYFVAGYAFGSTRTQPEAVKFVQEIDSDAPAGVQRNIVHHSNVQSDKGDDNSASFRSSGGGTDGNANDASMSRSSGALRRDGQKVDVVRNKPKPISRSGVDLNGADLSDGSWSSYNVRNRAADLLYDAHVRYAPQDNWLKARPAWAKHPLREKPRPPAADWDAKAKSLPKFPSQADLDSIYADVQRMYLAETEANMNGNTRGQYELKSGSGVHGGPGTQCLDNLGHGVGDVVGIFSCHGSGGSQAWTIAEGRLCQTAVKKQVCLSLIHI